MLRNFGGGDMKKTLRRILNMLVGRAPDYDVTPHLEIPNLDNYAMTNVTSGTYSVDKMQFTTINPSKIQAQLIDASMYKLEDLDDSKLSEFFKSAGYSSNVLLTPNEMRVAMGIDYASCDSDITTTDIYCDGGRVLSYVEKR